MSNAKALSSDEIAERLTRLPQWRRTGDALVRDIAFERYLDGADFVIRLAREADKMDHHPSVALDYKSVTVTYSTHSAGGITALDFEAAEKAEELIGSKAAAANTGGRR